MVKDWGYKSKAKVLVVGHDPRLQNSDTIAEYAMFANHFTGDPEPIRKNKSKYNLAKKTFEQIFELTGRRYHVEDIYVTNLCNEVLPHAPKGKTVYIPEKFAIDGVNRIRELLDENKNFDLVFLTSVQVNYWFQKLGFYNSNDDFISRAEPKKIGVQNNPAYYIPRIDKSFQLICGNIYLSTDNKHKVIPILHPKNYPITNKFKVYEEKYNNIKSAFLQ